MSSGIRLTLRINMFVYLSVVAYFLYCLSLACPCLNKRITYLLSTVSGLQNLCDVVRVFIATE